MVQIQTLHSFSPARFVRPSIFYAVKMAWWTMAISGAYLLHSLFVKDPIALANSYSQTYAEALLRSGHITLKVWDRATFLEEGRSYIFMSNHPSMMDIPVLTLAIPRPLRMISKSQLAKVPLFGRAMARAGFIFVNREKKDTAISQLQMAKQRMHEGLSVWIAPEGTRSRQVGMRPFKKGGFHLAIELKAAIIPMWIENTENIMPANILKVTPNQVATVIFGAPIETAHLDKNDLENLSNQVREEIFKLRDKLK